MNKYWDKKIVKPNKKIIISKSVSKNDESET
jgi:hypothetical protein